MLGGALAGETGAAIGENVGKYLGGKAAQLFGCGPYTVRSNSIMGLSGTVPRFAQANESIRISHKEYLGAVYGSTTFKTMLRTPINPGNPALFPWLSQIAGSFEQYRMLGCVFAYKPTSGVVANSQALGTVCIASQYDVADAPFASKTDMLAYQYSTDIVPYRESLHPIECASDKTAQNILKVRTSELAPGDDEQFYDRAIFNVATEGMPSDNAIVGEIWVTYEFEFFKPKRNQQDVVGAMILREYPAATADVDFPLGTGDGSFLMNTFFDGQVGQSWSDSKLKLHFAKSGVYFMSLNILKASGDNFNLSDPLHTVGNNVSLVPVYGGLQDPYFASTNTNRSTVECFIQVPQSSHIRETQGWFEWDTRPPYGATTKAYANLVLVALPDSVLNGWLSPSLSSQQTTSERLVQELRSLIASASSITTGYKRGSSVPRPGDSNIR